MWMPPGSNGINAVALFPEIFKKHDSLYFQLPGGRMSDYFASSAFLYASQDSQNINMIFSAVQRLYGGEFEDFQAHIKRKAIRNQLLGIINSNQLLDKLKSIQDNYNEKYGMRRQIMAFYTEYLSLDDKKLINTKLPKPASYKPQIPHETDPQLKIRIDFLLEMRSKYSHAATYTPFSAGTQPLHLEREPGNPNSTWLSCLTFEQFYQASRRAMASFWLKEYEEYWNNGGKEIIEKVIKEVQENSKKLNEEARRGKQRDRSGTK